MEIRFAQERDLDYLLKNDGHVPAAVMRDKVTRGEVIVLVQQGEPVGWLRYGAFWDMVPFMNMLAIEEEHRGQGWGTRMIAFWEAHLRQQGHEWAMTSTQANERAQHLYRRLGYEDVGGMRWPQDVALELLLLKRLEPEAPGEA